VLVAILEAVSIKWSEGPLQLELVSLDDSLVFHGVNPSQQINHSLWQAGRLVLLQNFMDRVSSVLAVRQA
jgi:hypothetical protein